MTNAQIILLQSVKLMEQGILQGTGEYVVVEDQDGNKRQLEIPEQIHTFAAWKELGYQVKKGEHAIASFVIWKHTTKKAKEEGEQDESRMFMKKAHFFKASQVQARA